MPIRLRSTRPDSDTVALAVLAFIASDDDRLAAFMALTGLTPDALRRLPQSPEGLAALLDYLLADEPLLLQFCATGGHTPQAVTAARQAFPGAPLEV